MGQGGRGEQLPAWLIGRLEELDFHTPTASQRAALGPLLDGEDVVLHAQTGSGKTLAYLLPLLTHIDPRRAAVQALVCVPSRELGLQVASVLKQLCADTARAFAEEDAGEASAAGGGGGSGGGNKIMVMSALEGSQLRRQRAWAWAEPPHVVIATAHALCDMVRSGGLRVRSVRYVAVDEADALMLDEGWEGPLHELLSRHLNPSHWGQDEQIELAARESVAEAEEATALPAAAAPGAPAPGGAGGPPGQAARQTVFCSATVPQARHFVSQCAQRRWCLQEPQYVRVAEDALIPEALAHHFAVCRPEQRPVALRALLRREWRRMDAALVFAKGWAKEEAAPAGGALPAAEDRQLLRLAEVLSGDVAELSGGEREELDPRSGASPVRLLRASDSISDRAAAVAAYRSGKCRILVTDSVAERGFDVPETTHVFNMQLPGTEEDYLHRAGRAGRLGRPGTVVTIVSEAERFAVNRIANALGIDMREIAKKGRAQGG